MQEYWQKVWQGAFNTAGIIFVASLAVRLIVMATMRLKPDLLSRKTWKIILWVSSIVLVCSIIYLFCDLIMPILQNIKYKLPIIIVGIGIILFVVFFGIAAILYYFQASVQSQSAVSLFTPELKKEYDDFIKSQRETNKECGEFKKDLTRLQFLKYYQPKLNILIDNYNQAGPIRYNQYKDNGAETMGMYDDIGIDKIKEFARIVFDKEVDIYSIDSKKYDIYKPVPGNEEKQVTDESRLYEFRKAYWQHQSGKDKLNQFKTMIEGEIRRLEGDIYKTN